MSTILEISTTNFENDQINLKQSMEDLQKLFHITDGYFLSEPTSKFGWTFFQILIKPILFIKIQKEFQDMIKKSNGRGKEEKFINFLSDFFNSRGCNVKLKFSKG